jgi:serine/threonine-protein kinase
VEQGLVAPFGRYVLQERLARGGMGEVFRAVALGEHGFEKPVVVKRVLPAHAGRDDLTELFVAEAKLMTRLAHPNIVEVLDFGKGEQKDYYLVLELVDGTDLGRLMRAHKGRNEAFPIPLALFVTSQVLRGLHYAHTRASGAEGAIVHRDVSPSNVLCSVEGEVKVADFGVALVAHAARGAAGVAGKPGYMAPEQLDGGQVDARADIFSVGVVLQQMLTGELPFGGDTLDAQRDAVRRGERRPARDLRREVSEALEDVLARAMAPSPEERFPDARAMGQAIETLRDDGQRIASSDDLAEAVRAAQRDLPAEGRPVLALPGAASSAIGDDAPRELTRTPAPDGGASFTVRLPPRSETRGRVDPGTERIDPSERPPLSAGPPPVASPREARATVHLAGVAALLALGVAGGLGVASRPPPTELGPHVASVATGTAADRAPGADGADRAFGASGAPLPSQGVESDPLPAPVQADTNATGASAPRPRLTRPLLTGAAATTPVVTSAVPEACVGTVNFFSNDSWIFSGGPTTVESPVTGVRWPCGSYKIVARSRKDPTVERALSVTVGSKQPSVVDIRSASR